MSTLLSHHHALHRTDPKYIIYHDAFWDPRMHCDICYTLYQFYVRPDNDSVELKRVELGSFM